MILTALPTSLAGSSPLSSVDKCAKGHVLSEDNVGWHKDTGRNRVRKRCMTCRRDWEAERRGGYKDTPSRAEMLKQATDFLHEDIEDLLNYGATYSEIIERGGYANWGNLYKSLKRRGRTDLIDRLREQKVKV
jgi:hypothetical protein